MSADNLPAKPRGIRCPIYGGFCPQANSVECLRGECYKMYYLKEKIARVEQREELHLNHLDQEITRSLNLPKNSGS